MLSSIPRLGLLANYSFIFLQELATNWSAEVGEAFVNDFFEGGFQADSRLTQDNTITFLTNVAMETRVRKPNQMSSYLTLLHWLHVPERYTWYVYLEACNKVKALRRFIETKLPWYLQTVFYSISEEEFKSLLHILDIVEEENWEQVLAVEDL